MQSERPEDIPGSFKYHGILEQAFRQTFPPGQEEQPMFWFKDKYQSFSAQSIVEAVPALDSDNLL